MQDQYSFALEVLERLFEDAKELIKDAHNMLDHDASNNYELGKLAAFLTMSEEIEAAAEYVNEQKEIAEDIKKLWTSKLK